MMWPPSVSRSLSCVTVGTAFHCCSRRMLKFCPSTPGNWASIRFSMYPSSSTFAMYFEIRTSAFMCSG